MKTAAASLPTTTKLGAAWAKDPLDIEDWIRSARRVWKYLKHPRRQKKTEHTPKDREIGREIPEGRKGPRQGRPASRRTVQRGLQYLDVVLEAIKRDWSGGHGRVIRITLPLAGDDREEKEEEKAKAKAKARPAPAPTAATEPARESSSPPAADDPPAEPGQFGREWKRARAEAEASRPTAEPAREPGPDGFSESARKAVKIDRDDLGYLEIKEGMGELTPSERERLEALRRNRSP
jgi:hypothetical protein